MWSITDKSGRVHKLEPGLPFLVGRQAGILFPQTDLTVHQHHAAILVHGTTHQCIVTDLKTKFGTYLVNSDSKVIHRITDSYNVRPNDRIRFGGFKTTLTFSFQSIVVMISSLKREDRESMAEMIQSIGGGIIAEWTSNCTYLTVPDTCRMTAKLACAMAAGIPIVTCNFWRCMATALQAGKELPNPQKFLPQVQSLVPIDRSVLLPRESRKTIFKDIRFVFFRQDQLETYKTMIELAGGRAIGYNSKVIDEEIFRAKDTRFVLFRDDDSGGDSCAVPPLLIIANILAAQNRRMITKHEIHFAILDSSVETFTNPHIGLVDQRYQPENVDSNGTPAVDETDDIIYVGTVKGGQLIQGSTVSKERAPLLDTKSEGVDENSNALFNQSENCRKRRSEAHQGGEEKKKLKIDETPSISSGPSPIEGERLDHDFVVPERRAPLRCQKCCEKRQKPRWVVCQSEREKKKARSSESSSKSLGAPSTDKHRLFRPEVLTGQFFGKKFKKQPVKIPIRIKR
uniref:BRCT domain-containing protein n=1 Tax=Bracon brevicornis TaxID=1563983 RepID=A0A6V7JXC4_9HYME